MRKKLSKSTHKSGNAMTRRKSEIFNAIYKTPLKQEQRNINAIVKNSVTSNIKKVHE